jgi:hypothetical protein
LLEWTNDQARRKNFIPLLSDNRITYTRITASINQEQSDERTFDESTFHDYNSDPYIPYPSRTVGTYRDSGDFHVWFGKKKIDLRLAPDIFGRYLHYYPIPIREEIMSTP